MALTRLSRMHGLSTLEEKSRIRSGKRVLLYYTICISVLQKHTRTFSAVFQPFWFAVHSMSKTPLTKTQRVLVVRTPRSGEHNRQHFIDILPIL